MATSGGVKGGQDMVVSIRYRNDLPPPPMPPKLLNIDNGGLAQYLTTSFAAAMARREEPNIEADAEGGMPIDMIGIPGYFLGDESAIMAPEIQPVLDPADHALMLTPEQLRNQDSKSTNVSFLRRTQYMSSHNARANDPLVRPNPRTVKSVINTATRTEVLARDDKENILRNLQKGFDLAYPESMQYNGAEIQSQPPTTAEKEAWRTPVHPDNPSLKPISFFPILPDFDTPVDFSGLNYVKFDKPPLPAIQGRRDDRIDVALLSARTITSLEAAWRAKKAAFDEHPDLYEDPGFIPPQSWSLCIAQDPTKVPELRKILDDADSDHDSPDLYAGLYKPRMDKSDPDDARLRVDYDRVRTYLNVDDAQMAGQKIFGLSLYDSVNTESGAGKGTTTKQRAAYYQPILSSLRLKSDRVKVTGGVKASQIAEADQNPFGSISVYTREITAAEKENRWEFRSENDSSFQQAYADIVKASIEEKANEAQEDVMMGEGEGDVEGVDTEDIAVTREAAIDGGDKMQED
jgi:RNA polymerase II-associated factor 1